jgi:5'-nucleotidase
VIKRIQKKEFPELPEHTLLNLNVPDVPYDEVKGVKVTRQGFRHYSGSVIKRQDHRGRSYFWVGGEYKGFRKEKGADCDAVENGFASITPLQLDCTHHQCLDLLSEVWKD